MSYAFAGDLKAGDRITISPNGPPVAIEAVNKQRSARWRGVRIELRYRHENGDEGREWLSEAARVDVIEFAP